MELNTGTITADAILDEVDEIARALSAAGSHVVLVTFGSGCSLPDHDAEDQLGPFTDVPVSTPLLPAFVEKAEGDGVYRVGSSDLFFRADDGRASFLLCEFSDVCCWTDDRELFDLFHDRWHDLYPWAYEADRQTGCYRRLTEGVWRPFATDWTG